MKGFCFNCGKLVDSSDPLNKGIESYTCDACKGIGTFMFREPRPRFAESAFVANVSGTVIPTIIGTINQPSTLVKCQNCDRDVPSGSITCPFCSQPLR